MSKTDRLRLIRELWAARVEARVAVARERVYQQLVKAAEEKEAGVE